MFHGQQQPKTLEEAVEEFLKLLPALPGEYAQLIKSTPKNELSRFTWGIGSAIRRYFLLDTGYNEELLRSCGTEAVPRGGEIVLEAVWERLQANENK
jgi:hypothetical protein